jgi:hypothetical protein
METATERITVLLVPSEKAQIAKLAKAANLSMGEFLRRAAGSFRPSELNDKVAAQQQKIDGLTERMIRLETALEISLARSSDEEARTRRRSEGKQQR